MAEFSDSDMQASALRKTARNSWIRTGIGALAILLVLAAVVFALLGLSGKVSTQQLAFLEQSVRRSAVQCYAIEGSYPSTEQGVSYLEQNYGLRIDRQRYVVYYESMGANLLPQVRVFAVEQTDFLEQISQTLGLGVD